MADTKHSTPMAAAGAAAASASAASGAAAASGDSKDEKRSKTAWPPARPAEVKLSNVKSIVIDNGTAFTKAGFSGEDKCKIQFPSVVGRPRFQTAAETQTGRTSFVGKEAQAKRSGLALKYPIEHGVVVNWDDMEALWEHIFTNEMKVATEEFPVLLTEAPLNPKANRERMMQIMFETFQVPASYVALTGALSLYGSGQTTGFVVECGEGVTHTVPIFDGQVLHHQISRLDFAGRQLTDMLMRLVNMKDGADGEPYSFSTQAEREMIRTMKEKLCYVTSDYNHELGKSKLSASNAAAIEKTYELPDGKTITLGTECFAVPEALFRPTLLSEDGDSETKGIPEAAFRSIQKSDMTLRRSFYENIICSGGSTLFPGFEQRLQAELTALIPSSGSVKVRVTREPNAQSLVWCGGSLLASLSGFAPMWITRDDYEEVGPAIAVGVASRMSKRVLPSFITSGKAKPKAKAALAPAPKSKPKPAAQSPPLKPAAAAAAAAADDMEATQDFSSLLAPAAGAAGAAAASAEIEKENRDPDPTPPAETPATAAAAAATGDDDADSGLVLGKHKRKERPPSPPPPIARAAAAAPKPVAASAASAAASTGSAMAKPKPKPPVAAAAAPPKPAPLSRATSIPGVKRAASTAPVCQFGSACYRKNAEHIATYYHPLPGADDDTAATFALAPTAAAAPEVEMEEPNDPRLRKRPKLNYAESDLGDDPESEIKSDAEYEDDNENDDESKPSGSERKKKTNATTAAAAKKPPAAAAKTERKKAEEKKTGKRGVDVDLGDWGVGGSGGGDGGDGDNGSSKPKAKAKPKPKTGKPKRKGGGGGEEERSDEDERTAADDEWIVDDGAGYGGVKPKRGKTGVSAEDDDEAAAIALSMAEEEDADWKAAKDDIEAAGDDDTSQSQSQAAAAPPPLRTGSSGGGGGGGGGVLDAFGRPLCRYGAACYRRNPQHFAEFAHPHLDKAATLSRAKTSSVVALNSPPAAAAAPAVAGSWSIADSPKKPAPAAAAKPAAAAAAAPKRTITPPTAAAAKPPPKPAAKPAAAAPPPPAAKKAAPLPAAAEDDGAAAAPAVAASVKPKLTVRDRLKMKSAVPPAAPPPAAAADDQTQILDATTTAAAEPAPSAAAAAAAGGDDGAETATLPYFDASGATTAAAAAAIAPDAAPDAAGVAADETGAPEALPSIFGGLDCFLYAIKSADRTKQIQRFWVAYDGDISKAVSARTTHLLTDADAVDDTVRRYLTTHDHVVAVRAQWALDSIAQKTLLPESFYIL